MCSPSGGPAPFIKNGPPALPVVGAEDEAFPEEAVGGSACPLFHCIGSFLTDAWHNDLACSQYTTGQLLDHWLDGLSVSAPTQPHARGAIENSRRTGTPRLFGQATRGLNTALRLLGLCCTSRSRQAIRRRRELWL